MGDEIDNVEPEEEFNIFADEVAAPADDDSSTDDSQDNSGEPAPEGSKTDGTGEVVEKDEPEKDGATETGEISGKSGGQSADDDAAQNASPEDTTGNPEPKADEEKGKGDLSVALRNERQARKADKAELAALREWKAKQLEQQNGKDAEPEFKILTEAELADLKENDPDEAIEYRQDLFEHRENERVRKDNEAQAAELKAATAQAVEVAAEEFNAVVPDQNTSMTLYNAGLDIGFEGHVLQAITAPDTKIVLADGREFIVGKGAVSVAKLLASHSSQDPAAREAEINKRVDELAAAKKEEWAAEVMSKIKKDDPDRYVDLGAGDTEVPKVGGIKTEAELEAMSAKEYDDYLQGQK